MEQCKICLEFFKDHAGLHKHVGRIHKVSVYDYEVKYNFNEIPPTCACGCGEQVAWNKGRPRKFVHGHANRDAEVRRKMIVGGTNAAHDPEKLAVTSRKLLAKWQEEDFRKRGLENWGQLTNSWHLKHKELFELNDDYRNKLSDVRKEMWKSEYGEKQREMMNGDDFRNKVSEGTSNAYINNPELCIAQSKRSADNAASGKIGLTRSRRSKTNNFWTGEIEHFDSSYERVFYELAIIADVPLTKKHNVRIPYYDECGKYHTYAPDFLTLDCKSVYETKIDAPSQSDIIKRDTAIPYLHERGIEYFFCSGKQSVFNSFGSNTFYKLCCSCDLTYNPNKTKIYDEKFMKSLFIFLTKDDIK